MMKIIEENKENPFESKIELTDTFTKTFTPQEVIDHRDACAGVVKRAEDQLKIFDQQDQMAFEIMPALKDIEEKDYFLMGGFINRQNERKQVEDARIEYQRIVDEYTGRIDEIRELGIKIEEIEVQKPVESPYKEETNG